MTKKLYEELWKKINDNTSSVWDDTLKNVEDGILLDKLSEILQEYIKIDDNDRPIHQYPTWSAW